MGRSPALIPCDEDEVELPQQDHDALTPCPAPQKYNLREQAVHIINLVIFEESPNVTSVARSPKHINKYTTALKHIILNEKFNSEMYTPKGMFVGAITAPETGKQLEYGHLVKDKRYMAVWEEAFTKELDQLAQGKCGYTPTNTISFIHKADMPVGRRATYGQIVCNYRPQKADPNRVRLTVG
eukprot:2750528-Ditylum_brightwellii.AAC.1